MPNIVLWNSKGWARIYGKALMLNSMSLRRENLGISEGKKAKVTQPTELCPACIYLRFLRAFKTNFLKSSKSARRFFTIVNTNSSSTNAYS